ncbi:hypothetical protein J6590_044621 [Homalodisca vitripennis]|nr:hypothetical protein J6590_044621 [Homalodisca vitripennis]
MAVASESPPSSTLASYTGAENYGFVVSAKLVQLRHTTAHCLQQTVYCNPQDSGDNGQQDIILVQLRHTTAQCLLQPSVFSRQWAAGLYSCVVAAKLDSGDNRAAGYFGCVVAAKLVQLRHRTAHCLLQPTGHFGCVVSVKQVEVRHTTAQCLL